MLTARDVVWEDLNLLFEWSNDPLVRMQSYHSDQITREAHERWFKNKLKDEQSVLRIFLNEQGHEVGLVRFEMQGDHAIIGVSVSEKHRGKGYASEMIKMACLTHSTAHSLPIYAYIKSTNASSIRSFEKAGFSRESELIYQDFESILMIWK